jgi:hypothetical protein
VKQPPGFESVEFPHKVYRLRKAFVWLFEGVLVQQGV